MSSVLPPSPLSYEGQTVVQYINKPFPPPSGFKSAPVPCYWTDTSSQDVYSHVGNGVWINLGGTGKQVETLTGTSGGAVSPSGTQNINTLGTANQIAVTGNPGTNTLTWSLVNGVPISSYAPNSGSTVVPTAAGLVNMTGVSGMTTVGGTNTLNYYAQTTAKYVVDPTANVGTHQTITAALAAANSGQTIFIRPGTYTENPTLKAGVNLTAFECDAYNPSVTIVGKCTATFAGVCALSGITLQTNADYCVSVSGAAATVVNLKDCYILLNNANGLQLSSSSGSSKLQLFDCRGNTNTTGIAYFDNSGAGAIKFFGGVYENDGASSTTSTISGSGSVNFLGVDYFDNPITTSSTSNLLADSTNFLRPLIVNGTGAANGLEQCSIASGAASALTVGAGATVTIDSTAINSSNTNAITGAGSLVYSGLTFIGTSSLMNVSTMTGRNINTGGISFDAGVNTLSNYIQAGTFTPSIQFGGLSVGITYTNQIGEYTRIGNLVFVRVLLTMSNKGSSTGNATMAGFPISAANSGEQCFLCTNTTNITYTANYQYTYLDTAGTPDTVFDFYQGGSAAGAVALDDTAFANNTRFEFNAVYFADGV